MVGGFGLCTPSRAPRNPVDLALQLLAIPQPAFVLRHGPLLCPPMPCLPSHGPSHSASWIGVLVREDSFCSPLSKPDCPKEHLSPRHLHQESEFQTRQKYQRKVAELLALRAQSDVRSARLQVPSSHLNSSLSHETQLGQEKLHEASHVHKKGGGR